MFFHEMPPGEQHSKCISCGHKYSAAHSHKLTTAQHSHKLTTAQHSQAHHCTTFTQAPHCTTFTQAHHCATFTQAYHCTTFTQAHHCTTLTQAHHCTTLTQAHLYTQTSNRKSNHILFYTTSYQCVYALRVPRELRLQLLRPQFALTSSVFRAHPSPLNLPKPTKRITYDLA